jgi:transcriptional regulator with XRE-family HTH domain
MIVADRLRALRERKKLSQGDIQARTGLLRCYVSRVENGHTVPAVETLEKFARALEVPLYELLYEGNEPPQRHPTLDAKAPGSRSWGSSGKDARFLRRLIGFLSRMDEKDRKLLLFVTAKMAMAKGHSEKESDRSS